MIFGMFCGLSAAILNSFGYIFGARFLLHYKSALRLTLVSNLVMTVLSLPLLAFLFPYGKLPRPGEFLLLIPVWIFAYWLGQGSFFMALKYFSRIGRFPGECQPPPGRRRKGTGTGSGPPCPR